MSAGGAGDRAEIHHQHRDVNGGWLRPSVFGAMDGLVSNFALIAGVAGGTDSTKVVVLAGVAGLAAGAFSMAGGEYVSVASQRELALAEIDVERRELERHPDAEQQELAQLYEARGVEPAVAAEVARQISRDPAKALEVHTEAELGVTPRDLPSPRTAAFSSFLSFSVGAILPLLPYLLGVTSLVASAVLSCLSLFGAGALVSRVTARSWWYSGLRQLLVGVVAAGLTFALGNLLGGTGL
ncbi:VIT1/CCC1 family predicted Fe2+/Mn2+ transporter [Streptosporangium becharense]|uniref:VIT1/CCC1 family predicted Fe2+/Mn2+ transporter n=1 Tax=Streptosporangium becharense TaxID=1816182 RepID=A0A7W9IDH2_9ACTN|nr:VIT1/CCC1 transporter family protein [Streptosporangium becharense]MBB2912919.1 VIT1/CCC1 family predicted Fe2+/Mn2+ transporter [Streptosporangium becharense]MBB5818256.1 VIT1/CCC1 family predicted Fe2+/Mn2+ transporter [Streptosporangium becharense]